MRTAHLYCNAKVMTYILEYVNSFISDLNLKLVVSKTDDYACSDTDIHIFIQTIPENILKESATKKIILLNIEQTTRDNFKTYVSNLLNNRIKVLDYSVENIQLLKSHPDMFYLPYQYNNKEISKLKRFITITEKAHDVVFVGVLSPKRRKIFDELSSKIKILHVNGEWYDPRDKKIASAKILLNVHYDSSYDIYEVPRCDRWTFAGMMVISEKSKWNEMLDISELVIFEDYDQIVDKVIRTVHNYDSAYKSFLEKYNTNIDRIASGRSGSVTYVKEMLQSI